MASDEELNKHAQAVAAKLGVTASVKTIRTERSDVDPGGERIELTVYRHVPGQQTRQYSKTFRPDRADLKAVVEEEIAVLAPKLFDAK